MSLYTEAVAAYESLKTQLTEKVNAFQVCLDAACNAKDQIVQLVTDKTASLSTLETNYQDAIDLVVYDKADTIVNLLPDSGRFFDMDAFLADLSSPAGVFSFGAGKFVIPYNGATVSQEGSFNHNNSTFGGTASALSAGVEAIVNASTGRHQRYGISWNTLLLTSGSLQNGAAVDIGGVDYYRGTSSSLHAGAKNTTISFWAVSLDQPVAVLGSSILSPTQSWHLISPSDGAVYVTYHIKNNAVGYNVYPRINFSSSNHRFVIGQCLLANGIVNPEPTWHPIPTVDRRLA